MSEIKPYTTYQDMKSRTWVVIDIDYWGYFDERQKEPQRVVLYQVGSNANLIRPNYLEFIHTLKNGQMWLSKFFKT